MARSRIPLLALAVCVAVLAACGNEPLLQTLRKDTGQMDIRSLVDGQVLMASDGIPVQINSQDSSKNRDLELEITIYGGNGDKLWSTRLTAPVLNEPLPAVQLPDLAPGQYRLETTLTSAGEEVQKKTAVFFATKDPLHITGIKSFPPVITSSAAVLLKAVLDVPAGVDPYLRWSWRGTTIADGLASKGFGQVLWTAPGDEGVYTVTLELFPVAPRTDGTVPFRSSISMSTDVYVSAAGAKGASELAAASSYYALYRFQGSLRDEGGMKKQLGASAVPVGSPEIVATDRGFGYTVDSGSGFRIPWFVLPLDAGALRPFTLSIGVTVDDPGADGVLASVKSADGAFAITLSMTSSFSPQAVFSSPSFPDVAVPSEAVLSKDERHLLSVSFIPLPKGFGVEWFVDGQQTNAFSADATLPSLGDSGEAVIGGPKGFAGTVDLFCVYGRDAAGRPAPDPALYARAAALSYGDTLVLAEGFDGISLPPGFILDGGELFLGTVLLPAGSSLTLVPASAGGDALEARIRLSASSAPSAALKLTWEGQDAPFFQAPVAAKDGEIRFSLGSAGVTALMPDGQKTVKVAQAPENAALVVSLSYPKDAKSVLQLDRVLLTKTKE